jgi:DNA polymerase III subunit beta
MKFQVDRASLAQVLQKVQSITEKKSSMAILGNALIKASLDQSIEFSGTDLELNLWTKVAGQVEEEGSVTVSARKFLEIIREVPQDLISIEGLPNNRLVVLAGRSRFELSSLPAEDFPNINLYQHLPLVPTNAELLRNSLNKTFYAIPVEEDSFTIAGLYWHPLDGKCRFVSTDGHRLAFFETLEGAFREVELEHGLIIPRKGVQEILKLLEKETTISIGIDEKYLILRAPSTFLSILLLDAEFPEYEMIIPAERPSGFEIERDVLLPALKRVAVLTDNVYRHVRFNISKGRLELDAGNPELGSANDVLDIDYEGEDFTVAFNNRYVVEGVSAIEGSTIRFEWVDQFHGGIFIGKDDPGYLSLIMPMVV